jgi:hypothetical protein
MPKPPDVDSKTNRLVMIGKDDQEVYVKAFKELCARNNLKVSDIIFEKAVLPFLREHNWPPGNSQTTMKSFVNMPSRECFFCKKPSKVLFRVEYISGLIVPTCRDCLDEKKKKGRSSTVKRVIGRWE